jgi:hypothetical protein
MKQKDAIALIYALARKSLEDPKKQKTAIKKIAEIIEQNFMDSKNKLN